MALSDSENKCGYCGGDLAPKASRGYASCVACGSLNLRPLPAQEDNEYFEGPEAVERMDRADLLRRGFLEDRLSALEAVAGPPKGEDQLFEIGCGTGRVLELARGRGWRVAGLELSAQLAERARIVNPAVPITTGDVLTANELPAGECKAVVALDVIEHVVDPVALLRVAASVLMPGGFLLLHTPNSASLRARLQGSQWNMLIPKYHLNLATPKGLSAAAARAGFMVRSLHTTSGTGRERGLGAMAGKLKGAALGAFKLGNAIEAVLQRTEP